MNKLNTALLSWLVVSACQLLHAVDARIILPKPTEFKRIVDESNKGVNFLFYNETVLLYEEDNADAKKIVEVISSNLKTSMGYELEMKEFDSGFFFSDKRPDSSILFTHDKATEELGDEGYKILVEKHLITVTANKYAGFFNATQTIRQLLPKETESKSKVDRKWNIPACRVKDIPVETWRACRLDCASTYQSVDTIKQFIKTISRYKLNTMYWTVTGNGGWRIESKKYPKLNAGKFYTKADIDEIISYAKDRNVKVIPHVEFLNNTAAVLKVYPQLLCKPAVKDQDFYCIGQEKTAVFLEDICKEVDQLFPDGTIMVDTEKQARTWKKCRHCQEALEDEGLTSYSQLSDNFLQRVTAGFNERKSVIVNSFYTSLNINKLSLEKSYNGWTGHVKNLQFFDENRPTNQLLASVSTVDINDSEQLQEAMLPNIIAFSERLWTQNRSFDSFKRRMNYYYQRLDYAGVSYRVPQPETESSVIKVVEGATASVKFTKPVNNNFSIYYTTDGTEPYDGSELYKGEVKVNKAMTIKAKTIAQNGKESMTTSVNVVIIK